MKPDQVSEVREIQNDFGRYRSDLKEDISQSILARYVPESMLLERATKTDKQVQATIKVLANGDKKYDRIMAKGTKEKKLKAMRDPAVGSAGVMTVVLYAAGMILAISMMKGFALFEAVLFSELMAKLSMVIQANRGLSAWQGLSSPFTQSMKDPRKLAVAAGIAIIPTVVFGGLTGIFVVISCVGLSFLLLAVSNRSFGGISGDVFGASNELVRLASLLIFASV